MLNRRHIRVKVMQSIYAITQSKNDDLVKEEKFLKFSIASIYDLYVLMLSLLVEIRNLAETHQEIGKKKYLATSDEINPSRNFIDNKFLQNLKDNSSLQNYIKDHRLLNWKEDNEYVRLIFDSIKKTEIYRSYVNSEDVKTYKEDLAFINDIYTEIIAPNEKLFDYFEDKKLSWVDDIPFVNTWILKSLNKIKPDTIFSKESLYKDKDDENFTLDLLKKTALHHNDFSDDIDKMTPNWDTERIAEVDLILIKMALIEFVHFPSIPTRVTINEYIEIAKDYSTAKSGFFINGVLDKLLKEFTASKRIEKIGRGLL